MKIEGLSIYGGKITGVKPTRTAYYNGTRKPKELKITFDGELSDSYRNISLYLSRSQVIALIKKLTKQIEITKTK